MKDDKKYVGLKLAAVALCFAGMFVCLPLDGSSTGKNAAKNTNTEENRHGSTASELYKKNVQALIDTYPFTDINAVLGAVQRLEEAGCRELKEVKILNDGRKAVELELKDKDEGVFYITMSFEGYAGPIRDENGNYLYTPLE